MKQHIPKSFLFHFASTRLSISFLLFFCLFFSSQSCTLYPRYERPCMEMPEHWRIMSDETSTIINVRWWEQLNDPVLNDLIQEALESNNDLRTAAARIEQFRAQLGIVSSQFYPQIYGQGELSRQRISQTLGQSKTNKSKETVPAGEGGAFLPDLDVSLPTYFYDYRTVLTAAYEFDLWGKIRSAAEASYADLWGTINARRSLILSIVSSVAATYILLRQYDLQLHISLQTLHSREESFRLAKLRFEEGLTSALEVAQSASERDEARIQVIQYQNFIPHQENLISVLIGHPPRAICRGKSLAEFQLPPEIPAGLPSGLLEQRPDILQAEDALLAANFRIGEARALYFPNLTLTGFYGYQSGELKELFTDPSRSWQWMLSLLQPIFTGWRITSQVEFAKAKKQEALYQYLQVILNALKEVNDALISHHNAKQTVAAEKERVKDLKEYLHLATLQYENGLVDYLNVLDAERRLFDAQLDLAREEANIFITLVSIYKALGGGWVIDAENMMKEDWIRQNNIECKQKVRKFRESNY